MSAAIGRGGEPTDSKGAILVILSQRFGTVLLVLLIIDLIGYALWRLMQATAATEGHGTPVKGLAIRRGLFGSAISHLLLAAWALSRLLNNQQSERSDAIHWLSSSFGQVLTIVASVICGAAGAAHMCKGWSARFERYVDLPTNIAIWAAPLCRFGLIVHGLVWCIVGCLLGNAALDARQDQIKGTAEALLALQQPTYDTWLLLIVACGLTAFGVYSCLPARYRHIRPIANRSPI